ncbi:MAG: hypothetical protein RJA81_2328 [Planctomycetota bacterium]|jgi:hypothetical protein
MNSVAWSLNERQEHHGRRTLLIFLGVVTLMAVIAYTHKAAEDRSAFVRWRYQVIQLMEDGRNIYDREMYPNPPVMPITLYPLMILPAVWGAVSFFLIKVAMALASGRMVLRMAREKNWPVSYWCLFAIALMSLRPILSDLQHGNINILIMFLVVLALDAWTRGRDWLGGAALGMAITCKVTPALFLPYFFYKRSWKMLAATGVAIFVFMFVVPVIVLGPELARECLGSWWHRIISPYVSGGVVGDLEINQSMVGVFNRLMVLDETPGRYGSTLKLNIVNWDPQFVARILKVLSLGWLGMMFLFCRTRTDRRDDPRLLGEFSLVVLTMLFVSERSWKHHYVTLLLPLSYLAYRLFRPDIAKRDKWLIGSALGLSMFLIATTSSEIGGWFANQKGHKIAQFYGMYFWAGVVIYAATAWRVIVEGSWPSASPTLLPAAEAKAETEPEGKFPMINRLFPTPHVRVTNSIKSATSEKSSLTS